MFRVLERRILSVHMDGKHSYQHSLIGMAETLEQAEELRIMRHKRRGTPLAEITIEEVEE
ncbi:hypothetical protein ACIQXW_23640 [Lysinibacillus sp. NPDC097162]|uniref:hypothetical protein n=1 Tax=Lysinibacillus sp. NPDC097162 TaxID=3364140 RepID=UPI003805D510